MAVPPAKGLDETCAQLRKAALIHSPTGHKDQTDYGHGREVNCKCPSRYQPTRTRARPTGIHDDDDFRVI